MLVGHSRGAKVNSLAAAWFPQDVRGIVNIDPVDSLPPFYRLSPDYPSALPLVRGLSTPTLNVGSELGNQSALFGKACAPQGENNDPSKMECAPSLSRRACCSKQNYHSLVTSQCVIAEQEVRFNKRQGLGSRVIRFSKRQGLGSRVMRFSKRQGLGSRVMRFRKRHHFATH